jgi:hypothetical protein
LVQEIGHHFKTELTETGILAFLNKTFMHAYMAATTHRCHTCGKWTQKVEVLKLQPVCWKCFKEVGKQVSSACARPLRMIHAACPPLEHLQMIGPSVVRVSAPMGFIPLAHAPIAP